MKQNKTNQGEISQDKAGRLTNIAKSANELAAISADQQTPSVLIETEERDILVREYDSLTIAISSVKGGGEE